MTGSTRSGDRRYYPCELRRVRPGFEIDHPRDAYVREDVLIEAWDAWLEELFAPDRAEHTAHLIMDAAADDPSRAARMDHAKQSLTKARQQVAQYRRALDGGADAATLTNWITDAAANERAALADLDAAIASAPPPLTVDEVLDVVHDLGGMTGVLAAASPDDRARFYEALGVTATYDGTARTATLSIEIPRSAECVSEGGLEPPRPCGH